MFNIKVKLIYLLGFILIAVSISSKESLIVEKDRFREIFGFYDNEIVLQELIDNIEHNPSLDNYLKLLLLNNPGLKSSFNQFQASIQKIVRSRSKPDPKLGFTKFIEEIQTRTGPQTYKISLSQTFPWFGKLKLKGEISYKQAMSLWQTVLKKRLALMNKFKNVYYEYAYLYHATLITENNLNLLKQLEPMIQSKVQGGAIQKDLIRLQVEIAKIENNLESLKEKRPVLNSKLIALLNLQTSQILAWPEISEHSETEINISRLKEKLKKNNPVLKEIQEKISKAENTVKLSKIETMPDITVGLTYINIDESVMQETSGSGDDPIGINLAVNLPVYRAKYKVKILESRDLLKAHEENYQDKLNLLLSELDLQIYNYSDVKRQIRLYKNSLIPKAKQAQEITETAYSTGQATFLDIIDTQRTLLMFEKMYWRKFSDYHQILSEIENICGGNIYENN